MYRVFDGKTSIQNLIKLTMNAGHYVRNESVSCSKDKLYTVSQQFYTKLSLSLYTRIH